jgi:hypothetical protein
MHDHNGHEHEHDYTQDPLTPGQPANAVYAPTPSPRWRVRAENIDGATVFSAIVTVPEVADAMQFAAQGLYNTQFVDFDNDWQPGPVVKLLLEKVQ